MTADNTTGPRDDPGATQGAGRDWHSEILAVLDLHQVDWRNTCRCGWKAPPGTDDERFRSADVHAVDAIVAALGLHNLEQTTADAQRDLETVRAANRAAREQLAAALGSEQHGLAEMVTLALERFAMVDEGAALLREAASWQDRFRAERDAARRELEQLRGEIKRCLTSDPQPCDHEETDDCLDAIAALAGGAPATHNGNTNA